MENAAHVPLDIDLSDFVVKVVIPAQNEEDAIGKVIAAVPSWVDKIIVVDNGSEDGTATKATAFGAKVITQPEHGYGRACLSGIAAANPCDIIVFLDGDASDFPEEMDKLVMPIVRGDMDFIVGSRLRGNVEKGALTLPQRFGNALACWLMRVFWKSPFTDLGPFRAIRSSSLEKLKMQAPTFGWTVEMQVRALKHGLRVNEVPVSYRNRIGISKISGTVKGVIFAGIYILGTIGYELLKGRPKT